MEFCEELPQEYLISLDYQFVDLRFRSHLLFTSSDLHNSAHLCLEENVPGCEGPSSSSTIPPTLPWKVNEPVRSTEGLSRQGSGIIGSFGQLEELMCNCNCPPMEISSPSPATRMSFIHGKGLGILSRGASSRKEQFQHLTEVLAVKSFPIHQRMGRTETPTGSGVSSSSAAGHESSSQSKDAHADQHPSGRVLKISCRMSVLKHLQ